MVIDLKFFLKFKKGKISLFFFLSSKSQQVSGWVPRWMPTPSPGWVTTAWLGVPAVRMAVWKVRVGPQLCAMWRRAPRSLVAITSCVGPAGTLLTSFHLIMN